jgi:GR25 family glycosyltransferase involved in LPS biosynthesis
MHAFYINLDSADLRRKKIEEQIASSSLLFELDRFSAINGKDFQNKNINLSNGQWGCWLSHLSIIKSSLSNFENLLILEDDEHFTPLLNHLIPILENLNFEEWDLLYLDLTIVEAEDYLFIARKLKDKILKDIRPTTFKIPKEFTAYGTHAYVINGNRKEKIFDFLSKNLDSGFPIDNIFCHGIQEGHISAHITLPLLTSPGSETTQSQINNGSHPLENTWINFRNLISIYSIKDKYQEYLQSKLDVETKEAIINRLNFSCLDKFKPINR